MEKKKKCISCNRTEFKTLFFSKDRMLGISGEFIVKKCRCGLIFIDPMPSDKILKKYYPSNKYYAYSSDEDKSFFGNLRQYLINNYYHKNFISKLISSLVHDVPAIPSWKKNGKILDVGCGAGETLLLLKKLGWNVYGLDIDRNALDAAKKKGVSNVTYGTYKNIDNFPDNYFDAIRLYHVIEHLDNPKLALKIIRKKLKSNGELIIGTPNTNSITAGLFGKYWLNLDTPRHLILFNPKILQDFLTKEKYKIKDVDFCSGGGIAGSISYLLSDIFSKKINLLNNVFVVMFFYPAEWVFDKIAYGDVFIVRANKS